MLKGFKIGILSLFFLIFTANFAFAKPYVLENQNQLVSKTTAFIEILSDEVFEKTGVSLYIVALENLQDSTLEQTKEKYLTNAKEPYVLLFFTKDEKKIDIITSTSADLMFDKKEVYWNYIVPLIPKSDKEITQESVSAFLLNGFVDIADRIAENKGVQLEHSFPKEHKGVQMAVRAALYGMLFVLIALFVLVYIRRKK